MLKIDKKPYKNIRIYNIGYITMKWIPFKLFHLFFDWGNTYILEAATGGVLQDFEKFTGKHLCQSLFLNKATGLTPFLQNTSGWLLLIYFRACSTLFGLPPNLTSNINQIQANFPWTIPERSYALKQINFIISRLLNTYSFIVAAILKKSLQQYEKLAIQGQKL